MKKMMGVTVTLAALILATASQGQADPPAAGSSAAIGYGQLSCGHGDRGRLLRYERVASHPTADSVQAYFDEWIGFYQDFYQFPPDLPVRFNYGFDSYKVTYCTVDAALPGQSAGRPTLLTTRPRTLIFLLGLEGSVAELSSSLRRSAVCTPMVNP